MAYFITAKGVLPCGRTPLLFKEPYSLVTADNLFCQLVAVMVALAFSIVYAYTFNLIAIAIFTADAVYTDAAQFRLKFFDDLFFQSCAVFDCTIKHCSKFIRVIRRSPPKLPSG